MRLLLMGALLTADRCHIQCQRRQWLALLRCLNSGNNKDRQCSNCRGCLASYNYCSVIICSSGGSNNNNNNNNKCECVYKRIRKNPLLGICWWQSHYVIVVSSVTLLTLVLTKCAIRATKKNASKKCKKFIPLPGIEPGSPGWKPDILTTRQ